MHLFEHADPPVEDSAHVDGHEVSVIFRPEVALQHAGSRVRAQDAAHAREQMMRPLSLRKFLRFVDQTNQPGLGLENFEGCQWPWNSHPLIYNP